MGRGFVGPYKCLKLPRVVHIKTLVFTGWRVVVCNAEIHKIALLGLNLALNSFILGYRCEPM